MLRSATVLNYLVYIDNSQKLRYSFHEEITAEQVAGLQQNSRGHAAHSEISKPPQSEPSTLTRPSTAVRPLSVNLASHSGQQEKSI